MADDPTSWGARRVQEDNPLAWGAKRVEEPTWGETAIDVGKQVVSAVPRAVVGALTWPAQLMDVAGQGMAAIGLTDPEKEKQRQEFVGQMKKEGRGLHAVTNLLPEAKTQAGKYAGSAAEF